MSLFDPAHPAPLPPPDQAIAAVDDFLARCEAWALDRELPKRLAAYQTDPTPEHAARLHQWATWRDFVRHARRELADGTLDHWFIAGDAPPTR